MAFELECDECYCPILSGDSIYCGGCHEGEAVDTIDPLALSEEILDWVHVNDLDLTDDQRKFMERVAESMKKDRALRTIP